MVFKGVGIGGFAVLVEFFEIRIKIRGQKWTIGEHSPKSIEECGLIGNRGRFNEDGGIMNG